MLMEYDTIHVDRIDQFVFCIAQLACRTSLLIVWNEIDRQSERIQLTIMVFATMFDRTLVSGCLVHFTCPLTFL